MCSVAPTQFPTPSRTSSGVVGGALTTVTLMSFTDKIMITLSGPSGKLSHWTHVPLAATPTDPSSIFTSAPGAMSGDTDTSLLPRSDLTATTVLGGTKREEEVVGHTLATTIASSILFKRPNEERMLVLGLGSQAKGQVNRDWYEEVIGLVLEVL